MRALDIVVEAPGLDEAAGLIEMAGTWAFSARDIKTAFKDESRRLLLSWTAVSELGGRSAAGRLPGVRRP